MASDDVPERPEPRRWDGVDRRRQVQLPKEAWKIDPLDFHKLEALLACIKFSGIDLLDADDQIAFTERLAEAKRVSERRIKRTENRPRLILGIMGAIGSAILTLSLPDILSWLKSHWP